MKYDSRKEEKISHKRNSFENLMRRQIEDREDLVSYSQEGRVIIRSERNEHHEFYHVCQEFKLQMEWLIWLLIRHVKKHHKVFAQIKTHLMHHQDSEQKTGKRNPRKTNKDFEPSGTQRGEWSCVWLFERDLSSASWDFEDNIRIGKNIREFAGLW